MTPSRQVFAIPVLGRYGLTHGILAWARCCIWCKQNKAQMLAPFWLKVRVGPYLRRERDKRNYFLLFHAGKAIGGIPRLTTLVKARKVDVGHEWPEAPDFEGPVLLRFYNSLENNERKSFSRILGHGPYLRRELLAMTRRKYHPVTAAEPFIAVHVRLGDFSKSSSDRDISPGLSNIRLPLDWYIDRLSALRTALRRDVQAIVFSDGSDSELAELLTISGVNRAPKQASITDLLSMGQGAALIASASGFSMWGAFLGQVPRISFPGQSIVPVDCDPTRDIESGFGEAVPPSFVLHVNARIGCRS